MISLTEDIKEEIRNMKKILMILMIAFTMMTGLYVADVVY